MIINCPACERKFQVDDSAFLNEGARKVRCAGCDHIWLEKMPETPPKEHKKTETPLKEHKETVQPLSKTEKKQEPKGGHHQKPFNSHPKKRSGVLGWFLFFIVLCLALPSLMILTRQHIVRLWPQCAPFYIYAGIPTAAPDKHFKFRNTKWYISREKNIPTLKVDGSILYRPQTETARRLPAIQVTVYSKGICKDQSYISKLLEGPDPYRSKGLCIVDQWTFKTSDTLALPGEEVPFQDEKIYDPETITPENVVLDFVPI